MSNPPPREVNIDYRPNSNRRRHRYTVPPSRNCGGSHLALRARKRVAAPLEDDPSLPTLKEGHPSRRDVALQPVAPQGQPAGVLAAPIRAQKERARLQGEAMQRDRPTRLWMEAMGPRETGSYWGALGAPQLAEIAVYRSKNSPTLSPHPLERRCLRDTRENERR